MKKKIVALFLSSMMLLSFASCSKDEKDESKKENTSETTVETTEETIIETEAPSINNPEFREGYLLDFPFSNGSELYTKVEDGASATFENVDGQFVAHIENGGSNREDVCAYYGTFDIQKDVKYSLSFKISTDVNTQVKLIILGEDGKSFCESSTVFLYEEEAEYTFGFSHFDNLYNATLYIYYGNDPDSDNTGARNVSISELYLYETPADS